MTLPRGALVVWWRTIMALAALALLVAVAVSGPPAAVSSPTQPAMVPRSESTPPQSAMMLQSDDETAGPLDGLGDRLPDRAVARLGSGRLRVYDLNAAKPDGPLLPIKRRSRQFV